VRECVEEVSSLVSNSLQVRDCVEEVISTGGSPVAVAEL
jgi:hypothetical protein